VPERPAHPTVKALLLMLGITLAILALAVASTVSNS
jgi:hypothetical protein